MNKKKIALFTASALICLTSLSAEATQIRGIEYKGNTRIPDQTIFAYLDLNVGDEFNQEKLDESIKALYKTGFFADIKANMVGEKLVVEVEENSMINKVAFDGNHKIDDKDILPELSLKPRSILSHAKVQEDINRIIAIYNKRGRYSVKIEPKIIKLDQNRVNLVYEINEGSEAEIKKIMFNGNSAFSSAALADAIASKESRWYRFFSNTAVYDYDKFQYDAELLKQFYKNRGYADFTVISKSAELSPDKDAFLLTFIIKEGELYDFGEIEFSNQLLKVSTDMLRTVVTFKPEEQFNQELIDETVEALTDKLGEQGYPFVDVDAVVKINPTTKKANIVFIVKEGHKVYLNRINIKNNTRTLDKVIRRELKLAEGDPYNVSKIHRSKQRLENLGYFNKVDLKNIRTPQEDKMDLDIEVEETSTGSLNLAGGYNTSLGIIGKIGLSENNFLGRGQKIGVSTTFAKREADYGFTFVEPYLFNKNLEGGIELFAGSSDHRRESSFKSKRKGIVPHIAYDLTEHLSHSVRYTLRSDRIYDVASTASIYVLDQKGTTVSSGLGHSLVYDRLDSKIDPNKGYVLSLSQDFYGLGGDAKYASNSIVARYYYPILKKGMTLMFKGTGGYNVSYGGKKLRLANRIFLGPDEIRGFDVEGMGPRDKKTRDALGGDKSYTGTVELLFSPGLPEEVGVKFGIFNDIAGLLNKDLKNKPGVYDDSKLRASYGASMYWRSPMGPIGIHYGIPYKKQKYDEIKRFNITFSTSF